MNETIELDTITDLKELKSIKADQYDALVAANDTVQRCNQNIALVNQRIRALQSAGGETVENIELRISSIETDKEDSSED